MRGRIPVTNPHAIQLIVMIGALVLGVNAWFLATSGRDFPPYRCLPPWEPPVSYLLGGVRFGVALGFVAAALRRPFDGLRVTDPLLIGMVLALAASIALSNGTRAMLTGAIFLGRRGCIEFGPPFSYPLAVLSIIAGTASLVGAVLILLGDDGSED